MIDIVKKVRPELAIELLELTVKNRDNEIERLREALKHNQRPEGETLDGVIAWIKSDPQRFDLTLFKLQQKDSE